MCHRCDNSKPPGKIRIAGGIYLIAAYFAETLACWIVLVALDGRSASAQEMIDERREYNVKAVSLYAFGRYVTWPNAAFEHEKSPFVIGLLGGNPFGDALERIASKKQLNGRKIEVRPIASAEEAVECHMVFVSRRVTVEIQDELFGHVAGKPVLLVGETPGFTQKGGVINFYQSGSNIRFELNPEKGIESQLSLNAKLLSLGTKSSTRQ
jgi:hypothetical protein